MNIKNDSLKLNVCINKVDENRDNNNNNNNESANYYSKTYTFNELLKINDIFKGCNSIKDIKKILDDIFMNKPIIEIEENNIKIIITKTITYSFDFNLPKAEKKIYEQDIEEVNNINKKQENNINIYNHIHNKDKNKYLIINNINFNIKSTHLDENSDKIGQNIKLKKRILTLEENQKKFKNLLQELENDKENRIKLLEEQLNKIKDKINKEETNSISHLFFDEKLKKGLNGKSEPINLFINNKNQIEKNNNNPVNTIPLLNNNNNNSIVEKNNEITNNSNFNNIIQEKKIENDSNKVRNMSGFFKNVHNRIKNKKKDINKKESEEEENNYLYSISENEIFKK
jgi:hypothetical protein